MTRLGLFTLTFLVPLGLAAWYGIYLALVWGWGLL